MAKKRSKSRTHTNKRTSTTKIRVDVKLNLLHTVADAIYSTSVGKIREAVANSRDNGATWVVVAVDQMNNRLSIFDNGHGIPRKRFHEIFDNIGYGLLLKDDETKLSYFGIGLMSIFQLGNKVQVFTKPKGKNELLRLEIDTAAIFDPSNKDESISFLEKCLKPLRPVNKGARRRVSIPLLNDLLDGRDPVRFPTSFTEIVIEGVENGDLEDICSSSFQEELSRVLPLRVQDDERFLKRFTGKKAGELRRLLANPKYCKTIDFYFGVQEEGEVRQLWKYFPRFNSNINFPDDNVYIGKSGQKDFAYYVIHTLAEDLERGKKGGAEEERETGFWIRNQNFLVKSSDFLDKPGPGRKPKGTIDLPLRPWVFGEVFSENMNRFLTVSRNEFLFERPEFRTFRDEFLKVVRPLNTALRDIWERRKKVVDEFVEPFVQIAETGGIFTKTQRSLRRMIGEDLEERDFYDQVKKKLAGLRAKEIEEERARVDLILQKARRPIVLSEDDEILVQIDPSISGKVRTCDFRWDKANERVVVDVSPTLFEPKSIVFLGENYTIYYVAKKESQIGISIDVDGKKIYVNPFNRELTLYSVSILDVYVALQVADALSNNKAELKRNFLRLLGMEPSGVAKYIRPLGDDLRRISALRR